MAAGDVKLIGAIASPFVMRPRIALNIKGVAYEFLEEKFGQKSDLLLKSNPVYKKIPVLLHDDRSICESLIVVEYIDEVWSSDAPAILPADPYERAIARFWAVFIDDKWSRNLKELGKAETDEERKEAAEKLLAGLQLLEEAFEKCSKGKGFFGGDAIGYVDIALGCYLGWLKATGKLTGVKFLDPEKIPLLVGWDERFCAEEAVKTVILETDKLVELLTIVQPIWREGKTIWSLR